jgi:hypothetical protein
MKNRHDLKKEKKKILENKKTRQTKKQCTLPFQLEASTRGVFQLEGYFNSRVFVPAPFSALCVPITRKRVTGTIFAPITRKRVTGTEKAYVSAKSVTMVSVTLFAKIYTERVIFCHLVTPH